MSAELVVPIVASVCWLLIVGSALASFRLGWSRMLKMGLIWVAIFVGLYLIAAWFGVAQDSAS